MKGPLSCARDTDATPHRIALSLLKASRLLPAAIVTEIPDGVTFAARHALTEVPLSQAAEHLPNRGTLQPVINARLPIEASEAGRLHVFRPHDGGDEHYAVEIGRPDRSAPVLARLHSACLTGDVMGSLKCDCGPQLLSLIHI